MIAFPNCKINLGLHITAKRDDGFHDLETIFFPVPLTDVLEIITKNTSVAQDTAEELATTGIPVESNGNLCLEALQLLKKDFIIPPLKMHLHKAIPLGAGLGGGSSDGAFTLQLLNSKFNLNCTTEQLLDYALRLGSDGPFFIINKTCYASGRGEILERISLDLSDYKIVLVNPRIHIDTRWAFSRITPKEPSVSLKDIISHPVETWKDSLKNDFEVPVFEEYGIIRETKEMLYQKGAVYSAMSGSGSTLFGLFRKTDKVEIDNPSNYFIKTVEM